MVTYKGELFLCGNHKTFDLGIHSDPRQRLEHLKHGEVLGSGSRRVAGLQEERQTARQIVGLDPIRNDISAGLAQARAAKAHPRRVIEKQHLTEER